MKRDFKSYFFENIGYKIISLLISLMLWLTILGRRDYVVNKTMEIDFVTSTGQSIQSQSIDRVRVKVSGSRTALRKFLSNSFSESIAVDIASLGVGRFDVEIPFNRVDVPMGVKVLEIKPKTVKIEIVKGAK